MKKKGYKEGLKIDRYQLDRELEEQPQLYMEWALKAVEASDEKDWEKQKLDQVKAKAEGEIRKDPKEYGIKNSTEGAIKAAIVRHPKVIHQTKKYLTALNNERVLNKAEIAYKARQKMLEKLVDLNLQIRFAEVKVPISYQERKVENAKRLLQADMKKQKIKRRKKK